MRTLLLLLFVYILTFVWPLELDETIAAGITLTILGAIAKLSPLGKVNIMS